MSVGVDPSGVGLTSGRRESGRGAVKLRLAKAYMLYGEGERGNTIVVVIVVGGGGGGWWLVVDVCFRRGGCGSDQICRGRISS